MHSRPLKILIALEEPKVSIEYQKLLTDSGYQAEISSADIDKLSQNFAQGVDVVFWESNCDENGTLQLLKEIKAFASEPEILVVSSYTDHRFIAAVIRSGAFDVLPKPLRANELVESIHHLENVYSKSSPSETKRFEEKTNHRLVGNSLPMQKLRQDITKIAQTDARVIIYGESGTGKELVAETIHRLSERSRAPLIKINCAAIPRTLFESELFGHEKGAFTGAIEKKTGLLSEANHGTLLFDEVGEMALETQAKLLRALQENEFLPVGGKEPIPFDVRIIAATNKVLKSLVKEGRFRMDLYYRLNVITIFIPPLRFCAEDIELLINHFSSRLQRTGTSAKTFTGDTLNMLKNYSWPGNVRELKNMVERAAVMVEQTEISPEELIKIMPDVSLNGKGQPSAHHSLNQLDDGQSLREKVLQFEKQLLLQAYAHSGENVSKMARMLKTDRANLHRKLVRYKIR